MDCSLYEAARDGKINVLNQYVNKPEILSQVTIQPKDNLLHIAANFKQLKFAERTADLRPLLLTLANSKGDLPLHTAARTGCSDMVEIFIRFTPALCYAPWNMLRIVNQEGDTPLHVAVKFGHLDVVNLLVQKENELLCIPNNHYECPLYLAVERGRLDIVNQILHVFPTCCHGGSNGMTALHAAVVRSHQEFELGGSLSMLSLGKHLWRSTRRLSLPLTEYFFGAASRPRDLERPGTIAPELLSLEGLRRFVRNQVFKLWNCLPGTVSYPIDEIMKVLLEKRNDMVKATDKFKRTSLHYAAQLGHLEATRKFLECDSSVADLQDEEDSSALHIAAKKGYINIMEEITKHRPCAFHLVDNKGQTVLHVAAKFGKSRVVKYILKVQGWESLINETDYQGNTAMHLAAIYGQYMNVWILAGDLRVDKWATNKEYLKAIDIVQSNVDVGEIKKYLIMRRLEHGGARQSVNRVLVGENTDRKNNGNEEAIDQLREDRPRISVNASESLRDRNDEVVRKKEISSKYLKDVSNIHLLVSTLIATVTFAAGFSLPGGYNEDDPNKGKTVLSANDAFKTFVIADAIAFYCSTAAVFLHFFASLEQSYHLLRRFIKIAAVLTYISILLMVIAFASGIYVVLPDSSPISTTLIALGGLFFSFYIIGIL